MSKIIIGFSTPKKFNILSLLIRKIEKTQFSHVYVRFKSESLDRTLVYQASGLAVNFVGSTLFELHHDIIQEFEIEVSTNTRKEILQDCVDLAGFPYGLKELFGLAIVRLLGFFGKKIKNPFSDHDKTYICSELVGKILVEHFNYKIEDLDNVSPRDIYLLLKWQE